MTTSDEALERRGRATMRDVAALAGRRDQDGLARLQRRPDRDPRTGGAGPHRRRQARVPAQPHGRQPAPCQRPDEHHRAPAGGVSNPYASAVHRAVEDYAREHGVFVLAASLDEDPLRERELARRLIDRRVDGLIVMPAGRDHRYVVAEQQAGTSFVFIDRPASPLVADAVVTDNRAGARAAVRPPAPDRAAPAGLPRRRARDPHGRAAVPRLLRRAGGRTGLDADAGAGAARAPHERAGPRGSPGTARRPRAPTASSPARTSSPSGSSRRCTRWASSIGSPSSGSTTSRWPAVLEPGLDGDGPGRGRPGQDAATAVRPDARRRLTRPCTPSPPGSWSADPANCP